MSFTELAEKLSKDVYSPVTCMSTIEFTRHELLSFIQAAMVMREALDQIDRECARHDTTAYNIAVGALEEADEICSGGDGK